MKLSSVIKRLSSKRLSSVYDSCLYDMICISSKICCSREVNARRTMSEDRKYTPAHWPFGKIREIISFFDWQHTNTPSTLNGPATKCQCQGLSWIKIIHSRGLLRALYVRVTFYTSVNHAKLLHLGFRMQITCAEQFYFFLCVYFSCVLFFLCVHNYIRYIHIRISQIRIFVIVCMITKRVTPRV